MEITNEIALELGLAAGDQNMRSAGREEWSEEDASVATAVYTKLKQGMQESPENGQTKDGEESDAGI